MTSLVTKKNIELEKGAMSSLDVSVEVLLITIFLAS